MLVASKFSQYFEGTKYTVYDYNVYAVLLADNGDRQEFISFASVEAAMVWYNIYK